MSRIVTTPDCNLYESACDLLTVAIMAICTIRELPFVEDDIEVIAETLLEDIELSDIHALANGRSSALLAKLLRQADACLSKLLENGRIDIKRISKSRIRKCALTASVEVDAGIEDRKE